IIYMIYITTLLYIITISLFVHLNWTNASNKHPHKRHSFNIGHSFSSPQILKKNFQILNLIFIKNLLIITLSRFFTCEGYCKTYVA
ncbi:hypothetical protein ACJX0J_014458, partial [Zea mays]